MIKEVHPRIPPRRPLACHWTARWRSWRISRERAPRRLGASVAMAMAGKSGGKPWENHRKTVGIQENHEKSWKLRRNYRKTPYKYCKWRFLAWKIIELKLDFPAHQHMPARLSTVGDPIPKILIRFENLPMMIRLVTSFVAKTCCINRWLSCDYHRVVIIMWSSLYHVVSCCILVWSQSQPVRVRRVTQEICSHCVEVQNPSGYVKVLWVKPIWPAWHSMAGLEMIYQRGISRFASPGQGVSKSTTVKIINVSDLSRKLILIWKLEDFPIMSTRD